MADKTIIQGTRKILCRNCNKFVKPIQEISISRCEECLRVFSYSIGGIVYEDNAHEQVKPVMSTV